MPSFTGLRSANIARRGIGMPSGRRLLPTGLPRRSRRPWNGLRNVRSHARRLSASIVFSAFGGFPTLWCSGRAQPVSLSLLPSRMHVAGLDIGDTANECRSAFAKSRRSRRAVGRSATRESGHSSKVLVVTIECFIPRDGVRDPATSLEDSPRVEDALRRA